MVVCLNVYTKYTTGPRGFLESNTWLLSAALVIFLFVCLYIFVQADQPKKLYSIVCAQFGVWLWVS